jgi:plasmid stabilization system protein ParE
MKVRYRQLALIDLTEIFLYLGKRSPSGAHNVLTAINAAMRDIAENPLSARKTSDGADEIEILHVRHGARRPWNKE